MTLHKRCLYAFALISILTFTGCQTAPPPEQKRDVAADLKAIDALRNQFAAACNSHDAAAAAAFYADDAIVMFPNQPAIEGRQGIQALLEVRFKENEATIAHAPLETVVADDWAYQRGNVTITLTPKSGTTMEESRKYLVILKRQADRSWKVYRDMSNGNEPPPGAVGKKR